MDDHFSYTPALEYLLQIKGEECEVWSNLHLMCYRKFKKRERMFNLPIITITAFIGFVSGLNLQYEYIHLILGGMSLYASLLKSYFSYLKISQKSENHRIAYIQYGQIATEIRVELALERSTRKRPNDMMDLIRIKMKNLYEITEIVDESIKNEYISKLDESNPNRINIMHWFRNERQTETNKIEETLGGHHIFKMGNRIQTYNDITNKLGSSNNGKPYTDESNIDESVSVHESIVYSPETIENPHETNITLNISETNTHVNADVATDDTVTGIMV
jgi:hypothetical protein